MTETTDSQAWWSRLDPLILPRVIIWAVVIAILSYTVADPDLWGHVKFGMDIVSQGSIPRIDPYSFTSDRVWINHEWLSEVVFGAAYSTFGQIGLGTLKLILMLLTFVVLSRHLALFGIPPVIRDVLILVAIVGSVTIIRSVRPQLFSLLFFVILLTALRGAERGATRRLWLIPPMALLWANTHGGWLVGIGILGVWTAIRLARPLGAGRLVWLTVGLGSLIATLATPYGTELWRFLAATVSFGRANIVEWQPLTDRPLLDAVPWLLGTACGAAILIRRRQPALSLGVAYAVLLVSAFRVVRLGPFFAVTGILLFADSLSQPAPAKRNVLRSSTEAWIVAALSVLIIGGGSTAVSTNLSCLQMAGSQTPDLTTAAAIRDARLSGRMLTWFDWGQYAIWSFEPDILVSMDGRRETVYSDVVLAQHDAIYRLTGAWQEELQRLNPDHVWLPKSVPTTQALEQIGWQKLAESSSAVVFSKRAPTTIASPRSVQQECFPGTP